MLSLTKKGVFYSGLGSLLIFSRLLFFKRLRLWLQLLAFFQAASAPAPHFFQAAPAQRGQKNMAPCGFGTPAPVFQLWLRLLDFFSAGSGYGSKVPKTPVSGRLRLPSPGSITLIINKSSLWKC